MQDKGIIRICSRDPEGGRLLAEGLSRACGAQVSVWDGITAFQSGPAPLFLVLLPCPAGTDAGTAGQENPAGQDSPAADRTDGLGNQPGRDAPAADVTASQGDRLWQAFLADAALWLACMEAAHPSRILLLSDPAAYGELFGTPHKIREEDSGYLHPGRGQDTFALLTRMAEDWVLGAGRERQIPVLIARGGLPGFRASDREWDRLWRVLEKGAPGEIYNVSGGQEEPASGPASPLSPLPLVLDCSRADRL